MSSELPWVPRRKGEAGSGYLSEERRTAGLAQVVERGTENPGVPSSTLGPGTDCT